MKFFQRGLIIFFLTFLMSNHALCAEQNLGMYALQRAGEHQIVFGFKKTPTYKEQRDKNLYQITFDTTESVNDKALDQITSAFPNDLKQAEISQSNQKLTLKWAVPEKYSVTVSRTRTHIAIGASDIKNVKAEKKVEQPSSENKIEEQKTQATDNSDKKTEEKKESKSEVKTSDTETAQKSVVPAKQKKENGDKQQNVAEVVPEKTENKSVASPEKKDDSSVEKTDKSHEIDAAKQIASFVDENNNISLAIDEPQSIHKVSDKESKKENIDAGFRTMSLSFSWRQFVSMAAFKRHGYLWIVFDKFTSEFKFDMDLKLYPDIIHEIVQIPHSQATVFRILTANGYSPSIRREGLLWIVDLKYQPMQVGNEYPIILQRKSPFGPRLMVQLDKPAQGVHTANAISIIDPEVGDMFYIIPLYTLDKGIKLTRDFVDVQLLQTVQGLVIVPHVEDVEIYPTTRNIEVRSTAGGLRFSSEDILALLDKKKSKLPPLEQILDVELWKLNLSDKDFLPVLKGLLQSITKAEDKDAKNIKRLQLARYYFSNGFYPECLSILETIMADDENLRNHKALLALRGATNYMMMRYEEAYEDLSRPIYNDDGAVQFWLAATASILSKAPEDYVEVLRKNMAILQNYPQFVKTKMAIAGLRSGIAARDEFANQNFMEAAYSKQNTTEMQHEVDFYHALWQESVGMYSMAIKEMKKLADSTSYYYRALGGLEAIRIASEHGHMSLEERVHELERLSYAWRGDEFEYNLMRQLITLFHENKDYVKVLNTLNNMKMRFSHLEESKKIPDLMTDLFVKIFFDEEDHQMTPIQEIALFNDFKYLLPQGEEGVQIITKLADKLVKVDLLEQASKLLQETLAKPLTPEQRGVISTRLALILLLNHKPEVAVQVIKESDEQNIVFSDKLKRQRVFIKAKGLSDLNKPSEAIEVLGDDESTEAQELRAEIYWQAQDWEKAADAMRPLIKKPAPKVQMSDEEAQKIMNWVAALRLAGRPKVVMRARENFMPFMEKTPLAKAFDFITKSPAQGVMDYREVAKEVEAVESFHSFAKDYMTQVKDKGLSQTVQ